MSKKRHEFDQGFHLYPRCFITKTIMKKCQSVVLYNMLSIQTEISFLFSQMCLQGLREDTHKKMCFFSGRTTKGVWRVNPPDPLAKKQFFSINGENSAQKWEKKKIVKIRFRLL